MESCVRGYHIYRDVWDAALGEELQCQRKTGNSSDLYAVAVRKDKYYCWSPTSKNITDLRAVYKKRRDYYMLCKWKEEVLS